MFRFWRFLCRKRPLEVRDVLSMAQVILDSKGTKLASKREVFSNGKGLHTFLYDGTCFAHPFSHYIKKCKEENCRYLVAVPHADGSLRGYSCNHPKVNWVVEIGGVQECPKKSKKVPW